MMAGDAVSEIKQGVNVYDITVQLPESEQANLTQLGGLQVRAMNGQLVDLANVVELHKSAGPSQIERQARQRQITVLAGLEGMALSDAMAHVEAAAKRVVPEHVVTGFVGTADMMKESFGYMIIALFLAVVLVYMILAAQFDSFIQPFNIMLSLPLSVIGAVGGRYLTDGRLNIFSMIGIALPATTRTASKTRPRAPTSTRATTSTAAKAPASWAWARRPPTPGAGWPSCCATRRAASTRRRTI
jgi:HAE1 family hydrophobic/amphiphilic exporter-1